jgi:4-hydroxy-tetrahydrodipicolinate synthase
MLYNNPPRTSVNVLPSTLSKCMELPNVVGIKDSSGDLTQSIEYVLNAPREALLFSGRDTIALAMLVHGGHGTISPAANVFPELMVRLYERYRAGDIAEATRISNVFAPLRAAWALGSFPVVIKEAMALAGRDAGPARRPILPLPQAKRDQLRKVVEAIGAESKRILASAPAGAAASATH